MIFFCIQNMIQIFPDKNHFLVKISQGKLFVMACQGIERDGKKFKTEIYKNHEYTTTLLIIFINFKI